MVSTPIAGFSGCRQSCRVCRGALGGFYEQDASICVETQKSTLSHALFGYNRCHRAPLAQWIRASASGAEGRRFEPYTGHQSKCSRTRLTTSRAGSSSLWIELRRIFALRKNPAFHHQNGTFERFPSPRRNEGREILSFEGFSSMGGPHPLDMIPGLRGLGVSMCAWPAPTRRPLPRASQS